MIIQSVNAGQGALPGRLISNDAPAVAVADHPIPAPHLPAVTEQPKAAAPTPDQLKSAVESINRAMQKSNQSLEFSVDPNTKTPVVKVMDTETGKVISQYPSEQVLAIAESIDQYLSQHQLQQGLLLKQKA
jgi:flagellar protein FlaG